MPIGVLPVVGGGGAGITQLTGDVIAGPGAGPQVATLVATRSAPKYLVGNIPNGDFATSYSGAGFTYIADPGDGTGIAAALVAAAAVPGDIHIRPGTYDLSTGAVVAPFVIPPNVIVGGAGSSTLLLGRSAGDQGVFVFQSIGGNSCLSGLRDMLIQVPLAVGAGVSSAVVVLQAGGCVVQNVLVEYQTIAGSALRNAFLVDTNGNNPVPVSSFENVTISGSTTTYPSGVPTSAVKILEGQINARNLLMLQCEVGVEIYNGNVAPGSGGCLFYGEEVYAIEVYQYGFLVDEVAAPSNVAAVRVSNSVMVGSSVVAPPLGAGTRQAVRLQASFLSTFSSCVVINFDVGVCTAPVGATTVTTQIDDASFHAIADAILFGSNTVNSSVSDTSIGEPLPGMGLPVTCARGITVNGGSTASGIAFANNTIHASDAFGSPTHAIVVNNSSNIVIEGNEVLHVETRASGSPSPAILVRQSQQISLSDNNINSTSNTAVIDVVSCQRTTVTGNVLEMPEFWTPYAIRTDSPRCTVTGNTIEHQLLAALGASIQLSNGADRCTVTGNAIAPSTAGAGPAISIVGSENAVTGNSCSLAVPPAVSAIEVSGNNNVVVANVCMTVPPVNNTGAGNEVAHNI